jgi:cell division protein FtsB
MGTVCVIHLQPQRVALAGVELRGQRRAVVGHNQRHLPVRVLHLHADVPRLLPAKAVFDRVLDEFVQDERDGGRLLQRQQHIVALHARVNLLAWRGERLLGVVQDARRDFAQAHHVQVLAREQLVNLRNRQDSAQAVVDDLLDGLVARVVHLQAHQAGDLLQVVFHAVVHLL